MLTRIRPLTPRCLNTPAPFFQRVSAVPVRAFSAHAGSPKHAPAPKQPASHHAEAPGKPSFTSASRLKDGRALTLDVWSIFHASNLPPDCINLGQGYMNFAPPYWARDEAQDSLNTVDGNHYAPPKGKLRLRNAIRDFYGSQFGKVLDPEKEIVVSSGANEGLYAAFTGWIEPGDEIIVFEPFFDLYLPAIAFNGGKCVYVPLHPSKEPAPGVKIGKQSWTIDFDELQRAVTPKTKMVILNSPHNPLGKVFTRAELEQFAKFAERNNLIVISDEVYESLVFDEREHIRFASLPGMWDRTITVGSAGKLFAATGWRVGWLLGPPTLLSPALAATTRIVFCSNTPLQDGAAAGLEQARARRFFETQVEEYVERRGVLVEAFERLGLEYGWPEGGYFVLLDISRVRWPEGYEFPPTVESRGRGFKASWFIANEIGVSCIPVSEFYCDEHASIGENYARFAFCKDVETLRRAGERLQRLRDFIV